MKESLTAKAVLLIMVSVVPLNAGAGCMFYSTCNLPVVLPGVYVRVLNDQTGQGITDAVVTVTTADGGYSETLSGDADGNYIGAYGLTGALTVTVEAPGFVGRRLDDVLVESLPGCQIIPADLTVRLMPLL